MTMNVPTFGKLDLVIGNVAEDVINAMGQKIAMPEIVAPEKARQRHMHIVGSNG